MGKKLDKNGKKESDFTDNICVKLYADDVKLYTRVKASSEDDIGLPTLQTDIDKLAKWAQLWQLPISYTKCSVMVLNCNKSRPSVHHPTNEGYAPP